MKLFKIIREGKSRIRHSSFLFSLACLFWFIFRVGTKPSRILYPCQRLAARQFTSYFASILPLVALKKVASSFKNLNKAGKLLFLGLISLLLAFGLLIPFDKTLKFKNTFARGWEERLSSLVGHKKTSEAELNHPPMGLKSRDNQVTAYPPNRVVRIHHSEATDWDFSQCCYWQHINQQAVIEMLERGVMALTDQPDSLSAWREIIPNYGGGDGIAIKVNNVNVYEDDEGRPNTSPEILKAVIAGLKSIGVPEGDITIYDVSDFQEVFSRQKESVQASYPQVKFVSQDNVSWDENERVNIDSLGISRSLPTLLTQSRYLININLMKGHSRASITGAMKNHFGTFEGDISSMHPSLSTGAQLAELNSNPHIRDKTRLIITEAYFMSPEEMSQVPQRLNFVDLFPERTPNSLFLSINPVAIDSVLFDYIQAENDYNGNSMASHQWLHIAAEEFGLGTHEHGTLGPGIYSNKDFTYNAIDYVNIDISGIQPTATPAPSPGTPTPTITGSPLLPTPTQGLNPCQNQLATCRWDPVSQATGYFYQIVDQNNAEIVPRTQTTNTFSQSFEPLLGDTYTCTVWATTQDQESQPAKGTLICQSFLIPTSTPAPGEPTPTAIPTIEPGTPTPTTKPPPAWCQRADVNGDGAINARDFFAIVESYARQGRNLPGDLNQDQIVNALDLSLLLICMQKD